MLPQDCTRVIYIDCDTLVCGSLKEMWETINNTLNGSWQTLLFVFATIIMIVVLIKSDYLKIRTAHVKIGVDEKERAILRQQTEWTYQYVTGLYGTISEKYPQTNPLKTQSGILSIIVDDIPTSSFVSDVLVKNTSPFRAPYLSISSFVNSLQKILSLFFDIVLLLLFSMS